MILSKFEKLLFRGPFRICTDANKPRPSGSSRLRPNGSTSPNSSLSHDRNAPRAPFAVDACAVCGIAYIIIMRRDGRTAIATRVATKVMSTPPLNAVSDNMYVPSSLLILL